MSDISSYSIAWLTDQGETIDVSNNILYTNINRFKNSYFNNFVDVSGNLIVRNGNIYNKNLYNRLIGLDTSLNALSSNTNLSSNSITIGGTTLNANNQTITVPNNTGWN